MSEDCQYLCLLDTVAQIVSKIQQKIVLVLETLIKGVSGPKEGRS